MELIKDLLSLKNLIVLAVAVVSGITSSLWRIDPFTGTEGKELRLRIRALETKNTELMTRLAALPPKQIQDNTDRIQFLERKCFDKK